MVELFLMQHGEAQERASDGERVLTPSGWRAVASVGLAAHARGVEADVVLHSRKVRAQQSAQLLAGLLGCPDVEPRDGLSPNDSVEAAKAWLGPLVTDRAVALVGHLPFLDRLASLLVSGEPNAHSVEFTNGALVHLTAQENAPAGGWSVDWIIAPGDR